MNAVRWVLDTNVVVSGLLSPSGPPGRLIDAALSGDLRLVLDDRIEAEYRNVLARPRLAISPTAREAFLTFVELHDLVTVPGWTGALPPDPDDQMFLEVAMVADDRVLVTGNLRHFPASVRGPVTVMSPAAAWGELLERRRSWDKPGRARRRLRQPLPKGRS